MTARSFNLIKVWPQILTLGGNLFKFESTRSLLDTCFFAQVKVQFFRHLEVEESGWAVSGLFERTVVDVSGVRVCWVGTV